MKARIKATGTIVEVEGLFDVGTALVNGRYFKVSELDFLDNFETIDWEQRRYELAKAAMQGYCIALGINDDSDRCGNCDCPTVMKRQACEKAKNAKEYNEKPKIK